MNPYQQPSYPNMQYPNNNNNQSPYPQMPTPDFNVNFQQQSYPGGGFGGGYPSSSSGVPTYPGYNQNSGIPTPNYDGGNYGNYTTNPYPPSNNNNNYNNYPNPTPQMPNYGGGGYPNQSFGGGYQSSGGFNNPPYQPSGGYNNPTPPYQPSGGYNNPSPPAPYQPSGVNNYVPPQNTSGNLFPNIATSGFTASSGSGSFKNYEGTLKPYQPFNPVDDAEKLYKAMKGIGTNESVLIDIICRRTNQQRQQIAFSFKQAYGKDLMKNVKSELSGDFEDLLVALLMPSIEFEAYEVREALAGAGTDEAALVDILCTKSNQEMIELRNTYKRLFHKEIEHEVKSDVSGYFKRILVSLINAHRSEAPADINRARQLAAELYKAGKGQIGTDEVTFNRIFASESLPQLKMVFEEYQRNHGQDIERAIKSEMSGDVERAFLAIAKIAKNPPEYYAERLHNSMKGAGTKDRTLIRNIVLRCEIDMKNIKEEFQRKYGKTLDSFVSGDLSGDYKKAVLTLIR